MRVWKRALACLVVLVVALPPASFAEAPGLVKPFRAEELEQIAAPIALYPDAVLAQVLMASTYPLEAIQAARFVQANRGLGDAALDDALRGQTWDDSVKSLVRFPSVLGMMNDRLDWLQKLGDAFLGQREDLMDAIQALRVRAQAAGTLVTTPQQTVTFEATGAQPIIRIEPATSDVVYVPAYDPDVVYGPWPYPLYPPYYVNPPGWLVAGAFFAFGVGILVGGALWGDCDWHHHHVGIHRDRYHHFTHSVNPVERSGGLERGRPAPPGSERLVWEHDPRHRGGVDYRDERTQQRFGRIRALDASTRDVFRGRADERGLAPGRSATDPLRLAPAPGAPPRVSAGQSTGGMRIERERPPATSVGPTRPPRVFDGLGRGSDVRGFSFRGSESLRGSESFRRATPPPPTSLGTPPRSSPGGMTPGGATPGGRRG